MTEHSYESLHSVKGTRLSSIRKLVNEAGRDFYARDISIPHHEHGLKILTIYAYEEEDLMITFNSEQPEI